MRELLIVLAIIVAVIAMIWYLRSPRGQTAAKPKSDESRGIQGNVGASDRAERAAAATRPAAAPSRATASRLRNDGRAGHRPPRGADRQIDASSSRRRAYGGPSLRPRRDRDGDPDRGGGVRWGAPGRRQVSAVVPDQGKRPIDALPRAGHADLSWRRSPSIASPVSRRPMRPVLLRHGGRRRLHDQARQEPRVAARFSNESEARQDAERVAARFCQRVRKGAGDPDRGGGERWGAPRRRNARLSLGLPDQGQRHIDALPRAGYANVYGDDRRVLFLQWRGGPGRWILLDHVLASAGRGAAPRGPTAEGQAARDQLLATPRPDSPLGDSGSELKVALGAICDGPRAHATVAEGRRRAAHHTGRRNHPLSRKRQSRHRGAGDQQHLHVGSVTV